MKIGGGASTQICRGSPRLLGAWYEWVVKTSQIAKEGYIFQIVERNEKERTSKHLKSRWKISNDSKNAKFILNNRGWSLFSAS